MADERIEDITGGALANIVADAQFVVLDPDDTTDDPQGTAKNITAAAMGLLETEISSADADVTGVVGVLHVRDISGYTADRDFILPGTCAVGDRCGIAIQTGDDAYELDIHTPSASGDTINGVNSSVGTASYTRLFITGEVMIFRCIVANTAWIVETDGRIPCCAIARLTTAADGESAATWTTATSASTPGVWTEDEDTGGIWDGSASAFTARRTGNYCVEWRHRPKDSVADAKTFGLRIHDGTNLFAQSSIIMGGAGASSPNNIAVTRPLTAGHTAYALQYYHTDGSLGLSGVNGVNLFSIREVVGA